MKIRLFLAAAAVAVAGSAMVAPAAAPVQASRDWSRTVVATPEGGFRMGNPAAKVKLVEYGSLTCPHCAHFSAEAKAPLTAYVRSGKVSFEFRNYVLNGTDVVATLVARCAPPATFFGLTESIYAAQSRWLGKLSSLNQAERERIGALPEAEQLSQAADIGGLTQLAVRAGLTPARVKQCVAAPGALERLDQMVVAAEAKGVSGTPTFLLNDANIGAHSWETLAPILREGVG